MRLIQKNGAGVLIITIVAFIALLIAFGSYISINKSDFTECREMPNTSMAKSDSLSVYKCGPLKYCAEGGLYLTTDKGAVRNEKCFATEQGAMSWQLNDVRTANAS